VHSYLTKFTFDPNKKKDNLILENNNLTCKSLKSDSVALCNIILNNDIYYWEIKLDEIAENFHHLIGIVTTDFDYEKDLLYSSKQKCIGLELKDS